MSVPVFEGKMHLSLLSLVDFIEVDSVFYKNAIFLGSQFLLCIC